jgi:hypothetical protein
MENAVEAKQADLPPRQVELHRLELVALVGRAHITSEAMLARFARALHTAIKKGRGAHTFSPREKVPRRGG